MVEGLCQRPAQGCQQVGAARVRPQPAEVLAGTPQRLLPAWRAGFAAVPRLTGPDPKLGSHRSGDGEGLVGGFARRHSRCCRGGWMGRVA